MSKFVLIDHSLTALGGHHYEYAWHILQAAADLGFQTHLACGAQIGDINPFPSGCELHPLYPDPSYGHYSRLYEGRKQLQKLDRRSQFWQANPLQGARDELADPKSIFREVKLLYRRPAWRKRFVSACDQLARRIELRSGDHVFLPTTSEFDLLGVANFLESASKSTRSAAWHVQFHLSFWDGRHVEWGTNLGRLRYMRRCVAAVAERTKGVSLRYYATTEELADQYRRLGLNDCTPLPYPVNGELAAPAEVESRTPTPRPLRVVVAGKPRQEKGVHLLRSLLDALWTDVFAAGQARLLVQSEPSSQPITLSNRQKKDAGAKGVEPIEHAPYPLGVREYADLIRGADVGLFLYDSDEYYVRCSGVLVEMLAAGKPVIVPDASWLSEQIREANQTYLSRWSHAAASGRETMSWEINLPANGAASIHETPWPGRRQGAMWSVCADGSADAFVRCEVQVRVDGHWRDGIAFLTRAAQLAPQLAWMPIPDNTEFLRIKLYNAFGRQPLNVRVEARAHELSNGISPRFGDVGLAAADWRCVPRLLRQLIKRYDEYRRAAERFSADWSNRHHPLRTVEILTGRTAVAAANRRQAA